MLVQLGPVSVTRMPIQVPRLATPLTRCGNGEILPTVPGFAKVDFI